MHATLDRTALQPPGAGIPPLERAFAGIGLRAYARLAGEARILERFRRQAQQAIDATKRLPEEQASLRVRIARIPGIEDSSREWSAFMVLEHLCIVNSGILGLFPALLKGWSGLREVRIQDVKPNPQAGPEQLDRFRRVVERYSAKVRALGHLHPSHTHPHPWFGELNARQWHALAAIHNGLHRAQIERITAVLASGG